jgi:hypothetical protein
VNENVEHRYIDIHTDTQTLRHTDTETHKQREREREREQHTEKYTHRRTHSRGEVILRSNPPERGGMRDARRARARSQIRSRTA